MAIATLVKLRFGRAVNRRTAAQDPGAPIKEAPGGLSRALPMARRQRLIMRAAQHAETRRASLKISRADARRHHRSWRQEAPGPASALKGAY
jgi:hypothetical protein